MGREPHLALRVDDETKSRWQAAARDAGYTLPEFICAAVEERLSSDAAPKRKTKRAAAGAAPVVAARTGMCPHRVPATSFCGRCGS